MSRAASRLSLIVIAALCLQPFGLAQNSSPVDETVLRAVAEELFAAYVKKDLDGLMELWSVKSPELATRRKAMQELFAANEKIEVKRLIVSKVKVEGYKASLRVTIEVSAVDVKTGKAAGGFGRMNRALDFVKEEGRWKVWREAAAEDDLAAALVAAQTDEECEVLLAAEKELLTEALWRALNRLGRRSAAIGRQSEALKAYGLVLSVAERIGDGAGIAAARNNIGLVYLARGDYDTALALLLESLRLHQAKGTNSSSLKR